MRYVCASLGAFAGGVLAVEWCGGAERTDPEMTQYHIIQNWLWLGAVNRWKKRQR